MVLRYSLRDIQAQWSLSHDFNEGHVPVEEFEERRLEAIISFGFNRKRLR